MGLSPFLSVLRRSAAMLLLVLGISSLQAWAQDCADAPANFVPFSSVYYVSGTNANGDRLVVGKMSLELFSLLRSQAPLPSASDQQFCSPLQIAPGLYVQAYVPTAAERNGDFSSSQISIIDPLSGAPFAGGVIPLSRLPDPIAWRIRSLATAPPATPAPLRFVPITPCRAFDTRNFNGGYIAGQTIEDFHVLASSCGVPLSAQAYSLNITVVPSGKLTYLTVFPTGQQQPVASTLNSFDGRIKANAAIIPAGINGNISVFTTDDTQLIIDINGYFVPASTTTALAFYPIPPCRLADTRGAAGPLGAPSLSAKQERDFPVLTSACNVPATAQAYALNYTVVPKGPLTYLTTWPTGQTQPDVSTLNAPTGSITANAAIVPAGSNGDISVYATDATDLIVDINGYFAPPAGGGLSLYNLPPCRVYDSRAQSGAQPVIDTTNIDVSGSNCGAPAGAQSYIFNATVIPTNSLLFLTLWPHGGGDQPNASTLNAPDGAVTSNMTIVPSSDGLISAFASHSTHLILDILGYFAP